MGNPASPKNAVIGSRVQFSGLDANAEVVGGENYIGELPPARMALVGQIRRIYLSQTQHNDPVLKVLYEATEGKYSGFSAWDNVVLNNKAAFKWKPLVVALGIEIEDLINSTRVDANDESDAGIRVVGIGALNLSGSNTVPVLFGVTYRNYEGTQQVGIAGVKPRKGVNFQLDTPSTQKAAAPESTF